MKLGKDTGSVMNHIYSRATKGQPEPEVGMGATILLWTDRHAATIIEVHEDKHLEIVIQEDTAERVDKNGWSESQEYKFTRNPNGRRARFRFKDGRWRELTFNERTQRWNLSDGHGLRIGDRQHYWDPSF